MFWALQNSLCRKTDFNERDILFVKMLSTLKSAKITIRIVKKTNIMGKVLILNRISNTAISIMPSTVYIIMSKKTKLA
jgi:hypothetical protein